MASTSLDTFASVALDGSGNGRIQLGPQTGQMWQVNLTSVSTISQSAPFPQCFIYGGPQPQQPWFIAGTYTGNSDSTGRGFNVFPGSYVWVVWTGGNPLDEATARIMGNVLTNYR